MKTLGALVAALALVLIAGEARADSFTNLRSGNWRDECVWTPDCSAYPKETDDVTIVKESVITGNGAAANLNLGKKSQIQGNLYVEHDLTIAGPFDELEPNAATTVDGSVQVNGDVSTDFGFASRSLQVGGKLGAGQALHTNTLTFLTLSAVKATIGNQVEVSADDVNFTGDLDGADYELSGAGEWNVLRMSVLNRARVKLLANLSLDNAATAFVIAAGGTLLLDGRTLTFEGPTFYDTGLLDLGGGALDFKGTTLGATGDIIGGGEIRVGQSDPDLVPTFAIQNGTGPFALHVRQNTVQLGGAWKGSLSVDEDCTALIDGTVTLEGSLFNSGVIGRAIDVSSQFIVSQPGAVENDGEILVHWFEITGRSELDGATVWRGSGSYSGQTFQIDAAVGSTALVKLGSDIEVAAQGFQLGAELALEGYVLTDVGPKFIDSGAVTGAGSFVLAPTAGALLYQTAGAPEFTAELTVASGTISKVGGGLHEGNITVSAAATLELMSFTRISGNFTLDGRLTAGGPEGVLQFAGDTLTNDGVVEDAEVWFLAAGRQKLAGSGTFEGDTVGRLYVDTATTVALQNDITYEGASLWIEGRIDARPYTLSVPCGVPMPGPGDVVGRLRRTHLDECATLSVPFAAKTSILFTTGILPSELSIDTALGAPSGFGNAVQRRYLIEAEGGADWSATLHLQYQESELGDNVESALQLFRYDGSAWIPRGATALDAAQNWVELSDVTAFSPWAIASSPPDPNFPEENGGEGGGAGEGGTGSTDPGEPEGGAAGADTGEAGAATAGNGSSTGGSGGTRNETGGTAAGGRSNTGGTATSGGRGGRTGRGGSDAGGGSGASAGGRSAGGAATAGHASASPPKESDGCGCSIPGGPTMNRTGIFALLASALLLSRRTRRRSA